MLKTEPVDLDRAPGMGFDKRCKVIFKLFRIEKVGTAVKMAANPADRPGVGIYGLWGLSLELEGFLVLPVKFVEAFRLRRVHGTELVQ